MAVRFKTYDFNKSSYLNYKSKMQAEAAVNKQPYKVFRDNAHKLHPSYHDGINVLEGEVPNVKRANYDPVAYMVSGEDYLAYLENQVDEDVTYPAPGTHWSKAAGSDALADFARSKGDLIRYIYGGANDAQSYYSYVHDGADPSKQTVLGAINILPFMQTYRIQNPSFLAKAGVPSTTYKIGNIVTTYNPNDKESNTEYYTTTRTVAGIFDIAAQYFENVEDGGVAVLSGLAYEKVDGGVVGGKISIKTENETTVVGEFNLDLGDYDTAVSNTYGIKIVDTPLSEEDIEVYDYEGVEGFEELSTIQVETTSYTGFMGRYNRFTAGASGIDVSSIRDELFELGSIEEPNLRYRILDEMDGYSVNPENDAPMTVAEAVLMVARFIPTWLSSQIPGIPVTTTTYYPGDDAEPDHYATKYSQVTYYMSTSDLKTVFEQTYKYFRYLRAQEALVLEKVDNYPLGKILNMYGGIEQFLSIDLPSYASILDFAFKIVNYDDISMYDKGNDPDKASNLIAFKQLEREIGRDKLFKVLRPVIRTRYDRGQEGTLEQEYVPPSWTNAIVANYWLDPVALMTLRPVEIMSVLSVMYGYMNLFAKKKVSLMKKIGPVLFTITLAAMMGPVAGSAAAAAGATAATASTVTALVIAGGVVQGIGILVGSSSLVMAGSIISTIGGFYGTLAGSAASIWTSIKTYVSNIKIIQVLQYVLKLATYVMQQTYQKSFDQLRKATNNAIEMVNEMEELITQIEFDRKVDRFIYGGHIENTYTRLYEYEYKYSYI